MDLQEAKALTNELMQNHGLYGWSFKWTHARTIHGMCYHKRKEISLSKIITEKLALKHVKDTILHEIAHALVGKGHGHDRIWVSKAIEIGCEGNRCATTHPILNSKYIAECKGCGHIYRKHRKVKRNLWCKCNNRSFDPEMKLVFVQQY